jgi:hypothetical protein
MITIDFASPIQSEPRQEKWWEAILPGLCAFVILPVMAYCLMVMLTEPQRITKVTDTSDVTVVLNGKTCREWSSPMFSNQKVRRVCDGN